jgi:hypothetical protein
MTPGEPRGSGILFELAGFPSARLRLCTAEFVIWSARYCCRVAAKALGSVPANFEFFRYLQAIIEWRDPDSNRGHHDFPLS